MEEIVKFLKEAETYYLATVEGDQPRVRPFGTAHIFEDYRIVYNENKRRTKFTGMEREKNELIRNTSYCNHCI